MRVAAIRDEMKMEKLLLISGPVGVGKTSVANELSHLLEVKGVAHTFIDLDALTYTYPRSEADPFGNELALENLAALWKNCRKRASKNLIIPRVIEHIDVALNISKAVGIAEPVICRLAASDETLLKRIRRRELGSKLHWSEKRSIQLSAELAATNLEDFFITTDDRSINQIATELMGRINWV